jgi:hypothetical protein
MVRWDATAPYSSLSFPNHRGSIILAKAILDLEASAINRCPPTTTLSLDNARGPGPNAERAP